MLRTDGWRDASRSQGRCPGNRETLADRPDFRVWGRAAYRLEANDVTYNFLAADAARTARPRTSRQVEEGLPSTLVRPALGGHCSSAESTAVAFDSRRRVGVDG